jgi:hypothetical protein
MKCLNRVVTANTYLVVLFVVDGHFEIVEALEEEVDVSE